MSPRNAASAAGDGCTVWRECDSAGGGRGPSSRQRVWGSPPGPRAQGPTLVCCRGTLSGAGSCVQLSRASSTPRPPGCSPVSPPEHRRGSRAHSRPHLPRFGTFGYRSNQHSSSLHLGGLKRRQISSEVKELTSYSCFRESSSGCCQPPALRSLDSLREDTHALGAPGSGPGSPWRASPGPPCAQGCLLPDEERHDRVQEGVRGVLGYRDLHLRGQT